jgi:hypothetical protein
MKRISLSFSVLLFTFLSYAQKDVESVLDSTFIQSKNPSNSKLRFINDCGKAKIIAEQDITNNSIILIIVGGISPTVYATDIEFENKYSLTYYDYGDLPASRECMLIYNFRIFEYLTEKFGKSWQKEIRKDVYGLKDWRKNKKNAT